MLVLTRKLNQKILIGDNVEITVCALPGGAVRLGIQAPPEVRILRKELLGRRPPAPPAAENGVSDAPQEPS